MRRYELTYLISDDLQETEIIKTSGKIGGLISADGGKIIKEESWGRRKLAYPILKQLFATYITINFELEPTNLKNIEKEIKHETAIIRHLLIATDAKKEKLSLTSKDIESAENIESVVGGEKSFEAILGETDNSLGLMAVRGESKDIEENTKKDKAEEIIELETKPAKEKKEEKKEVKKVKKDEKVEKKPIKKKAIKKDESISDEADRLAKLDEELSEILGSDL